MDLIEWNDDLASGIQFIDDAHKHLISLANTFISAVQSGHPACKLICHLTQIREQICQTIQTKEDIFALTRYPQRAALSMDFKESQIGLRRFQQRIKQTCHVTDQELQTLSRNIVRHVQISNAALAINETENPTQPSRSLHASNHME